MSAFKSSACILALCLPLLAQAGISTQLPTGTLSFVEPTGVVGAETPIDIRLRFTLDANSVPLNFSSNPLTGLEGVVLPTEGQYYDPDTSSFVTSPFVSYDGAYLNTFFGCSGTFTDSCITGTNYNFTFWTSSTPGNPSINFLDSFSLAPGASTEYLFGIFTPVAGGAAPGTYTFYNTGLTLNVTGFDAAGHSLSATLATLGETCPAQEAGCAFTRTVTAVPEPGSYGLMALGLAGIGLRLRRRR